MLAGILGATIGAAGGGINGALQGWQNLYNAKKLAKYNYDLQKRGFEEFPTSQRSGLEAAGYNPMLALGSAGSHTYSGGIPSGGAGMGDIVGSAKAGAMLANVLEEQKARIANVKADTELKEGQLSETESRRLQNEANTSLMQSQTERTDLAYGLDIANTVSNAAGVGAQAYSAKAMADNFKPKGKTANSANAGKPVIQSTPKAKPNAAGTLGNSAKNAGSLAKQVGKELLFMVPPVTIGAGVGAGMAPVRKREMNEHQKKNRDKSRKWYHEFDRFHFDY